jgi:tRNA dimethylallyltransferase
VNGNLNQSKSNKQRVIFIMGPTASGKTDVAIELRKHLPVELINVDSAQIYRDMDIGTAKPDKETLRIAPHRLIDICDPAESYSAADFATDAKREIVEIIASGGIPLLVGGSMLYFKVLLEGLSDLPSANKEIRDSLQQQADKEGWASLHTELQQVDPVTAKRLHPNHSQRIQRALEVYKITGIPLSAQQEKAQGGIKADYDIRQFALIPNNRELLHKRIEQRFLTMLNRGLEEEVKNLHQRGDLNASMPSIRSVGYRQLWDYCEGHCDLDQSIEKAIVATRQLAKRQQTWLRGWPDSEQITVDDARGYRETKELCEIFLKKL